MQIHNLTQGSPEWLEYRRTKRNASDAPSMMDVSPYKSRKSLIRELATGITEEIPPQVQRIMDEGHRFEALARARAEEIVGEALYPVTCSDGALSASFDGLTISDDQAWEHKSVNDAIRQAFADIETVAPEHRETHAGRLLPIYYQVQMEQQIMVSGCKRVLFLATKWSDDGQLLEQYHCWYYPNADLAAQIRAGWAQLELDVTAYVPTESAGKSIGATIETLPALRVEVTGRVVSSNLDEFKTSAMATLASVKTELTNDQDFADAETAIKWCKDAEERLAATKDSVLAQTETIDQLCRTLDEIAAATRQLRLKLDDKVKTRKQFLRDQAVSGAIAALAGFVTELGTPHMPMIRGNFAEVIKGKKSLDTIEAALSAELARAKAEARIVADKIATNLAHLETQGHQFLFADVAQLVQKAPQDFALLVDARIRTHQAEQAAKEAAAAQAKQAAAPLQAVAPAAPIVSAEPTGTLKLGDINARLGLTVTSDLLVKLGFRPSAEGASKRFPERDFPAICQALANHILSAGGMRQAA